MLRSRSVPLVAAGLAVLLALSSLGVGWMIDDYWHRAVLRERPGYRELLGGPSEMFRFFRGDPDRTGRIMDLGDQVKVTGMTVTITALTADGRPAEATFAFDVPLESPSMEWLSFRGSAFEPFAPPVVGREVVIDLDYRAVLSPFR